MSNLRTEGNVPYELNTRGEYVSVIDGQVYDDASSLAQADSAKYSLYRQLAGRELSHRECRNRSTTDEPVTDRYHGLTVTASTSDYVPPSPAQAARKAADYVEQRISRQDETHYDKLLRLSREQADQLEAAEAKAADREAIRNDPKSIDCVKRGRFVQTCFSMLTGDAKQRADLDRCEQLIELGESGEYEAFDELHAELTGQLTSILSDRTQARVDELTAEINESNQALAELNV